MSSTPTGNTNQSGPGSHGKELVGYCTVPGAPKLEPYHQMQFSLILRALLFGVLALCWIQSEKRLKE